MIHSLQEHELFTVNGQRVGYSEEKYGHLRLIQWQISPSGDKGYYASYKIGAEWIDNGEALVVTAKHGMERIDFLQMFAACLSSGLALDSFSEIYTIDTESPAIPAPSQCSIVSPLIVLHFLTLMSCIKALKKGYVHRQDNIRKVKGRIRIFANERQNVAAKRFDRICCEYDELSVDTPENRLLKKALLCSRAIIRRMGQGDEAVQRMRQLAARQLSRFGAVGDAIDARQVRQMHSHKLFTEYAEAVRLAKLILRYADCCINKDGTSNRRVLPFTLDMSLLYEHYVYGLLHEAYGSCITYQFKGTTGNPDFLYRSESFKAILDTKYIPRYEQTGKLDTYVVRQLSGYGRDLKILRHLGYEQVDEKSPIPSVPCVIICPREGIGTVNPFKDLSLRELCTRNVHGFALFCMICVPVPTVSA